MLKVMNRGVVWLTRVCVKRSGVLGGHRNIRKLGWSSLYTRDMSDCTIYRASLSSDSPQKCMWNALNKDAANQLNQSRMITCVVFVPTVVLQTKFERSLNFQQMHTHVLSTLRNHTAGFLVKICGECCSSTVLTAACCCLSIHCIPAQNVVSMSTEWQLFTVGLTRTIVLSPLLFKVDMNWIENDSQVGEGVNVGRRCHRIIVCCLWVIYYW